MRAATPTTRLVLALGLLFGLSACAFAPPPPVDDDAGESEASGGEVGSSGGAEASTSAGGDASESEGDTGGEVSGGVVEDLPPTIDALLIDGLPAPALLEIDAVRSALIEVSAADDHGVAEVALEIDGVEVEVALAPPYRFTWEIDDLVAESPRTLRALVRDDEGQEGASAPIKVTFDLPPPGSERWLVLPVGANAELVADLAVDGPQVIAVGHREGVDQGSQALLRRHDRSSGALVGESAFPAIADGERYRAEAVAVADAGWIAVAGSGSHGDTEGLWLARFSADGALLGERLYGELAGVARGIAVDGDALVVVGDGGDDDEPRARLARFSVDLEPLWARTVGPEVCAWSSGRGLALAEDGTIFTAGTIVVDAKPRLLAAAHTPAGDLVWGGPAEAAGVEGDFGAGLAIGHDGDLAVAGAIADAEGQQMAIRWLRSDTGESRGVFPIPRIGEGDEIITAITVDHHHRVYVSATVDTGIGGRDVIVFKRSLDGGASLWERVFDGSSHGDDLGAAIAVDTNGQVYAGGALIHLGAPRWWISALSP